MKLVFTLAARSDLQAIGDWIAQDNPARALSFIDELERHCTKLTRNITPPAPAAPPG